MTGFPHLFECVSPDIPKHQQRHWHHQTFSEVETADAPYGDLHRAAPACTPVGTYRETFPRRLRAATAAKVAGVAHSAQELTGTTPVTNGDRL